MIVGLKQKKLIQESDTTIKRTQFWTMLLGAKKKDGKYEN